MSLGFWMTSLVWLPTQGNCRHQTWYKGPVNVQRLWSHQNLCLLSVVFFLQVRILPFRVINTVDGSFSLLERLRVGMIWSCFNASLRLRIHFNCLSCRRNSKSVKFLRSSSCSLPGRAARAAKYKFRAAAVFVYSIEHDPRKFRMSWSLY